MAECVLIVDDDPVQRRLLQNMVEKAGYGVVTADGGEAAIRIMTVPDAPPFECVVLDLVMPDLDGLGVLGKMREAGLSIPVIVQTAHGGIDTVVSAMRAGAVDFVVKPAGAERMLVSLRNAIATRALEGEFARLKRSRGGTLSFKDIITRSAKMQGVLRAAQKTANSAIPVLVEGRVRGRQGADRPGHPRLRRPQGQAFRRRELRGASGKPGGIDPVRPREGGLHRRHRTP